MSQPNSETNTEKKSKKGLKILLIILCVILAIVIIGTVIVFIMIKNGEKQMLNFEDAQIELPDFVETDEYGKTVYYNGEKYVLNENITTILAMGVDRTQFTEQDNEKFGTNGQADSIFLIAVDTATGKIKTIALSRETMVDVDKYSAGGQFTGNEKRQLCLAYAYGDGREFSCENVVKSAQRIIYGLPINSYFAINFDAMGAVNNSVGGVKLKSLEDITFPSGRTIKKDEEVTLKDEEALPYCRWRDQVAIDANSQRMDRQVQFVRAYVAQAFEMTKKDITTPLKIYNTVSDNGDLITNINTSKISFLTSVILKNRTAPDIDFIKLKGETVLGTEGFAEFTPNETELLETILSVFYNKA